MPVLLWASVSVEQFWGRAVRRACNDSMSRGAVRRLPFARLRLPRLPSSPALPLLRWFDILVKGAAWPINPFRAKASEESPLELGSPYCSDPDCQYRKELRKALEEMNRDNTGR
jgi:hypothetical protein